MSQEDFPPKRETISCTNENEAEDKFKEILSKNKDFKFLTAINRKEAKNEIYLFPVINYNNITEYVIEWPIFDQFFTPDIKTTKDPEEILDFIDLYPNCLACDDPRKLIIGFVHYDHDTHISNIIQAQITHIRDTDRKLAQKIWNINREKSKQDNELSGTLRLLQLSNAWLCSNITIE